MKRIARIAAGLVLSAISAAVALASSAPREIIAQNAPAPPADQAAAHERLEKFNKAVETLNFASSWIDGSFASYARSVDIAHGPTSGHESPTIIGTSGALGTLKELEKYLDAKPGSEAIDTLARRYAQTGEALVPLLDRARLYYDQKDYKDDGYAKGREMHGPLVAAYREFRAAGEALRAEVRRFGEEERDKEMAALKEAGRMLRYNVMLNLKQARQTLEFLRAQLQEKHDADKIDSVALKGWNDAMDGTLAAIRELKEKDPAGVTREYRDIGAAYLGMYIVKSEEFLKATKYVQRSIRDHQPISAAEFEFGGNRQGDIIRRYNDIIVQANTLNQ